MNINRVNKILMFLIISIVIFAIEAVVIGFITAICPDIDNLFGIPFAFEFFVVSISLMLMMLIIALTFPRLNGKRCLD